MTSRFGSDVLVGTLHLPETAPARQVGILLLNAGPAPRAGNSDMSVHLGGRLSARGYACGRFDLVGLGDSTGTAPATLDAYWRAVLTGRNDESIAAVVRDLQSQLGVKRWILGGLCAGAVSAIRAAHTTPEGIEGLILLEPNFRTAPDTGPNARVEGLDAGAERAPTSKLARALSLREWLYWMTGDGRWANRFKPLHPLLNRVLERLVGHTLPRDAHVPLIMHWRRLLERHLPALVVTTESHVSSRYFQRIAALLPPECMRSVEAISISGTNHIMTTGDARRLLCDAVERWLISRFPIERPAAPPRQPPVAAMCDAAAR